MARRPKPAELHALEGTRSEVGVRRQAGGNRRLNAQPKPETVLIGGRGELETPPNLDEMARLAWVELRNQCQAVLDLADAAMLETAAIALGRFRQARAEIASSGLMVENRFGERVPNPALKVEQAAATMLHRAMVELGIGPSARARFAGIGVEAKSEAAELDGVADLVALRGGLG